MSFYSDLTLDATSLLAEFGQDVTITQKGVGEYVETASGINTLASDITTTVKGVLMDFVYRTFGEERDVGNMVQGADKRLFMQAGTVPTVRDTITVDGVIYSIVNIKQVNPAGTPVLYDLWLKS